MKVNWPRLLLTSAMCGVCMLAVGMLVDRLLGARLAPDSLRMVRAGAMGALLGILLVKTRHYWSQPADK